VCAGLIMLLWNPLTLAFDTGFQLSFVATLGLIFGIPIVERWFMWVRSLFMREIVSSTVAAQIAVLPLLLYQNGLFSVIALPANVLVLPLVPLAMLLSALSGIAGFLVPALAPAVSFPAYLVLSYITGIAENAANLPFAAFSLPAFPFVLVLLAYAFLGVYVARQRVAQIVSRRRSS
jgi:competence protein ComEC